MFLQHVILSVMPGAGREAAEHSFIDACPSRVTQKFRDTSGPARGTTLKIKIHRTKHKKQHKMTHLCANEQHSTVHRGSRYISVLERALGILMKLSGSLRVKKLL